MKAFEHQAIKIANRKGECLSGILSFPLEKRASNIIIVFCQAGLATKSGVGDQFKLMCDNLASRYHVLRFDQSGTGESEGFVASEIPMNNFFLKVMRGCFVDDTLDVIRWVRDRFTDFKIVLMGQCGGCLTAAYASETEIASIHSLVLIAPPVLYLEDAPQKRPDVRKFEAKQAISLYFEKLFSLKSYHRLLKGQTDIAFFYKCFMAEIHDQFRKFRFFTAKKTNCQAHEKFNWEFFNSIRKLISTGKKILIILPELDNETHDFDCEFIPILGSFGIEKKLEVEHIPECEHSIMFSQNRKQLDKMILGWLDRLTGGN